MKRTTAIINFSTILMISSLLAVGNSIAFSYGGIIDVYMNKQQVNLDDNEVIAALTSGKALAREVCEDGTVLLKNDGVLPLKTGEYKVNIFGWGASDNGFLYQGGGSSAGGYSGDKISFYEGFRSSGFEINEELAQAYNDLSFRREPTAQQNEHNKYYANIDPSESFYTESRMKQAREFSDIAIMVFSRRGSEGVDLPKVNYDENGVGDESREYLALSAKEELMVRKVTENFSKVICIFNTSSPMEMGFVDHPKINAALQIGFPGYYGTPAIASILAGDITPSGHLVDTAAYDLKTAPSYVNIGPDATHVYAGRGGRYTDYAEDIYVGYKWYETADVEGYYDKATLDIYGKKRSGYDAIVQYPFGYGESYTTFSWTLDSVTRADGSTVNNKSKITADDVLTYHVWVENTGDRAGKEVVQLYYSAPYTKGGIEKSSINLIDFQKTTSLVPGKGEMVDLTVKVSDMASYDTYDKNLNGFMGYELDAGTYKLSLQTDSHHIKKDERLDTDLVYEYQIDATKIENDTTTGHKVENRFTNYTNPTSGASSTAYEPQAKYAISIEGHDDNAQYDQGITYLTREDFAGTFPIKTGTRTMTKDMFENSFAVHDPFIDDHDVMPTIGSTETSYTLDDVKGLPYDDPKWEALLDQLTPEQMADLSAGGGFGTIAISSINKPKCTDSDGGTGFTSGIATGDSGHATKYPAANVLSSTFDWKAAYKWGHAIGEEGKALNIQGWYAPGCNIHRSPLGGRNFEYFSEDGHLAGIFVAYTVKGCTENGVYAYMKHFAGNDSDEGRNGQYKWMTEQSLREVWAKPGEIATKVGGANAMMVSVDRVGSVRSTGSYALLTSLLRDEWGFRGSAITDYYQGGNVNDVDEEVRAGCDLSLLPGGSHKSFDDYTSATSVIALRNAAHNILFTYIDTINRTEKSTGVDLSSKTGQRIESESDGSWWRTLLYTIDGVVGAGLLAWAAITIIFTWVKKHD